MMFKLTLGDGFDRLTFAGARNGDLPTVLAFINVKFFTPITSLVSQVTRQLNDNGLYLSLSLSLSFPFGPITPHCTFPSEITCSIRFTG